MPGVALGPPLLKPVDPTGQEALVSGVVLDDAGKVVEGQEHLVVILCRWRDGVDHFAPHPGIGPRSPG
jgi:hypothetical protein